MEKEYAALTKMGWIKLSGHTDTQGDRFIYKKK